VTQESLVVKHDTGTPVGQLKQRQHAPARPGAIASSRKAALVASARTVSRMPSPRSRSDILPRLSSARHRIPRAVGRAGICDRQCHKREVSGNCANVHRAQRCVFSVRASWCQGPRIRRRNATPAMLASMSEPMMRPHGVSVGALAAALAHVPT
jgi:hypothetical protein